MSRCFLMPRNMFVWGDETGTDKRKFGYRLRGTYNSHISQNSHQRAEGQCNSSNDI